MITLTSEEAQQVLDALNSCEEDWIPDGEWETRVDQYDHKLVAKALEILRARLAQPEQEPVAWMLTELDGTPLIDCGDLVVKQRPVLVSDKTDCIPLYTAPSQREWQGLTDDEVDEAEKEFGVWRGRVAKQSFESGAWWANEKLLEKNT